MPVALAQNCEGHRSIAIRVGYGEVVAVEVPVVVPVVVTVPVDVTDVVAVVVVVEVSVEVAVVVGVVIGVVVALVVIGGSMSTTSMASTLSALSRKAQIGWLTGTA